MQDKADNQPDTGTAGSGARLRGAREAAAVSVDEVADELHLDRNIILALEAEDYAVMGAPVFVKGHLRSYARFLGLPDDEVADNYQGSEPEADEFRTHSAPTIVKSGANLSNFILWVMLTIIVLVGIIYFAAGDEEIEPQDFVEIVPAPAPVQEVVEESDETPEAAVDVEARPDLEPGTAAEPEIAEAPVAEVVPPEPEVEQPPPVVQTVSLGLEFSAECWVEISDSQRRLLYGLEKAGVTRVLDGVPPFRLFLGNTEAVEVSIEGRSYEVPRAVRTGSNMARFVIDESIITRMQNQ